MGVVLADNIQQPGQLQSAAVSCVHTYVRTYVRKYITKHTTSDVHNSRRKLGPLQPAWADRVLPNVHTSNLTSQNSSPDTQVHTYIRVCMCVLC